jgi:CRISPR/Cas system-associated protein Cas10 (large subunit of type III CRISPR-Cas system)
MSFGISVNYEKYPLYEARGLLFDTAKKMGGKNAIAVSVRKHSGRKFGFVLKKDGSAHDTLKNND